MSEIQDEAYTELCEENEHLKKKLNRLKALCVRAADALEYENFVLELDEIVMRKAFAQELRKAAEK